MTCYIGLDLHKRYVHGCRWHPGAPVDQQEKHFRFPNTPQHWSRFVDGLDQTCWVALEVTGSAFEVHDMLSARAGKVLLANPLALKRLASGRHTDRVDAVRLAQMLALGTVPAVWTPPHPVREVRRLLHYRDRLVRTRRRAITQGKAVLGRHSHDLPREADLRRWLSCEELRALPTVDQAILLSAMRQITFVEEEIAAIEGELARRVAGVPDVELLLTITGVGLITAATIWAVLGEARRFAGPKQVTRYAGLDASVHQSGEQHRQGRISKNGSPLLRTVLVEAAHSVARYDIGPLGHFYQRKRRYLGHGKAIVALARKLLIVAWRMLLTGEPYRAANPQAVARKQRDLRKKALYPPRTPDAAIVLPAACQEPGAKARRRAMRSTTPRASARA